MELVGIEPTTSWAPCAEMALRAKTSGTLRPMTRAGAAPGGDLSQLEKEAAKVLPPESLAYILAGAGDTDTTRANAAAFRRWRIKQRKGPQAGEDRSLHDHPRNAHACAGPVRADRGADARVPKR